MSERRKKGGPAKVVVPIINVVGLIVGLAGGLGGKKRKSKRQRKRDEEAAAAAADPLTSYLIEKNLTLLTEPELRILAGTDPKLRALIDWYERTDNE